jgi:hypothetical protein
MLPLTWCACYFPKIIILRFEVISEKIHKNPVNTEKTFSMYYTVVVWFHDESTFYVNDWRVVHWVHKGDNLVPWTKGEGASLMVADFVSANYGWLTLPDGSERA